MTEAYDVIEIQDDGRVRPVDDGDMAVDDDDPIDIDDDDDELDDMDVDEALSDCDNDTEMKCFIVLDSLLERVELAALEENAIDAIDGHESDQVLQWLVDEAVYEFSLPFNTSREILDDVINGFLASGSATEETPPSSPSAQAEQGRHPPMLGGSSCSTAGQTQPSDRFGSKRQQQPSATEGQQQPSATEGQQQPSAPAATVDWSALSKAVNQPENMLCVHEGMMAGDDPTCATRVDDGVRPDILHFFEDSSGDELYQTCADRCKQFLREYRRYLEVHAADWYCVRFPARLASYWDPVEGLENMRRDGHLTGRFCGVPCKYCAAGVPQWSQEEYMKMHAYAMGFWDHPEYKLEIQRALHKDRRSNVIQLGSSEEQIAIRTPRMGNSISPSLDKFYDTYFGPASVSSMWTERGISKLQHHVGGLSCIKTDRVNLRMYKYNKGLLGELHMDIA